MYFTCKKHIICSKSTFTIFQIMFSIIKLNMRVLMNSDYTQSFQKNFTHFRWDRVRFLLHFSYWHYLSGRSLSFNKFSPILVNFIYWVVTFSKMWCSRHFLLWCSVTKFSLLGSNFRQSIFHIRWRSDHAQLFVQKKICMFHLRRFWKLSKSDTLYFEYNYYIGLIYNNIIKTRKLFLKMTNKEW